MWTFLLIMAALAAWFFVKAFKKKQPLQPGRNSVQNFEDKDAFEGFFGGAPEQRRIKKTVQVNYRDGDGNTTTRTFDIRMFEPKGEDGMIFGLCHLRNARRTLRFDRIIRAVDTETGEIIPDLQARLNQEWKASIEPVLDRLFAEYGDALKLMLYAAKADGAMRAKELDVIAKHCTHITGDNRITADTVKEMMLYVDLPTERSFIITYNKLRRERPDIAQHAAQVCREIVGTQSSIHPTEQAMLSILDKPLPKTK